MVVCRVGVSPARAFPAVRTASHPLRTAHENDGHSGGSACGMRWGWAGGCRCWRRSTSCARTTSTCRRRNSGRFGATRCPYQPRTLPCPTLPYPTLPTPYPTLPYPTLPTPYPTLPYPTLPYPTLPYRAVHSARRTGACQGRAFTARAAACIAYAPLRGVARATCRIARSSEYRPEAGVPRLASTQAGVPRLASTQAARIVHSVVCLCGHRPRCGCGCGGSVRPTVCPLCFALLCVCLSG